MEVKDKVFLVTGGSSGIGKATCELLASKGAKVSICDIQESGEDLAQDINGKHGQGAAIFNKCDVTNQDIFRDCFKRTIDAFGRIDVVFNNAGIWDDSKEGWTKEVDVNFKGVVNGCLLAVEFMGTRKGGQGGVVINTASVLGLATNCLMPIYSATKSAIIMLTRCFGTSFHYDLNKIRYCAVCPNATGTALLANCERVFCTEGPEIVEEFKKMIQMVPYQTAESVARCVVDVLARGDNGSVWLVEFDKPGFPLVLMDVDPVGNHESAAYIGPTSSS